MKNWDHYSKTVSEYPNKIAYAKQLREQINDTPLTAAERDKQLENVVQKTREWFDEAVKPYNDEQRRLDEEFWDDAREELGYLDFLPLKAAQILEAKAWQDGHANGYSEVFGHLDRLADFLNEIDKLKYQEKD